MVDLNPQRTIYTLEYMTGELIDKNNKDSDKNKAYNIISDLINIDKDVFVSNFDESSDNEAFVKELFERLYKSWDAKIDSINNIVKKFDFDKSFIKLFEEDFDIRTFYKIQKGNNRKNIVQEPENKIEGSKLKISDIFNNGKKKNNKDEKILIIDILHNIIAEVINILTIITSYNKLECLFNEKINIDDIDFKFEITKLLDYVNDDSLLKNIFINILKNRIINKEKINKNNIDDEKIFNIITNIINGLIYKQKVGGNIIEINNTIQQRKKKIYTIHEPDKLLLFIHDNLKPKDIEKNTRGEVFTPMKLVNEMLDTLPEDILTNPDLKWLDPAAGMGNFPVAIYMRLMECLKILIPDEEMRRKHILEKMLYMVELDESNVFMMKKILCGNKYKLNIFQGSFIDFKIFKKININIKFDIILGNPPFQYKKNDEKSHTIWHLFIERSYKELLNNEGYLLFIHPSGWRDIDGNYRTVYDYIKKHTMIYLSMNNFKTGKQIFGVGTNFDYYLVQNVKSNNNITTIKDIDNNIYDIDLNKWDFIPSGKFELFKTLLSNKEKINVLHDWSIYETRKKYISKIKDNIFKYPIIDTITKGNGCNFVYSKEKKGHFGISKVIWSNGAGTYPIIDEEGKYGLTQFAYAIIDEKDKLQKIKDAMNSEKFINLMEYLAFKKDNKYNYNIIALFKKKFYLSFINYKNKGNSLPVVNIEIPKRNIKSIG